MTVTNFTIVPAWTGGWTAPAPADLGPAKPATEAGVGGWVAPAPTSLDPVAQTDNGVGGWTAPAPGAQGPIAQLDTGVGGWFAPILIDFGALLPALQAGSGGWFINLGAFGSGLFAQFNGVGGWTAPIFIGLGPFNEIYSGAGGWFINLGSFSVIPISATFNGVGGWFIDTSIFVLPPRVSADYILLDYPVNRTWQSRVTIGHGGNLFFNVGVNILNGCSVVIRRPDGSYFVGDPHYVTVGRTNFPADIYFTALTDPFFAGQWVLYQFAASELDQQGLWTAEVQNASFIRSLPFNVYLA